MSAETRTPLCHSRLKQQQEVLDSRFEVRYLDWIKAEEREKKSVVVKSEEH